jgi:hypothetical protein
MEDIVEKRVKKRLRHGKSTMRASACHLGAKLTAKRYWSICLLAHQLIGCACPLLSRIGSESFHRSSSKRRSTYSFQSGILFNLLQELIDFLLENFASLKDTISLQIKC